MPDTHPNPDNETLIQTLLQRYEAQLRRTLAQKPRTLEQIEDTAEQIGNQVKRDLQQEIVRQEGTGEQANKGLAPVDNPPAMSPTTRVAR